MAFKFSVVMAIYNKEKYVGEAIGSIINQSLDFKKNIEIILVDDKSTDNTLSVLENYQKSYPKNITLITNEKNQGPAFSRNEGLKHARGEFVNFLDADDTISKGAFLHAYKFLKKHEEIDIVSIPIYYFGVRRGPHNLNFKFEKNQVINLHDNPSYIQLSGPSSFIRLEKLKNYSFNNNLKVSEDALLIAQMLLDNPNIGFLSADRYHYRKDGSQNSLITSSGNTRSYFTTRIHEYFFKLINYTKENFNEFPKFIQYFLMYDLQWIFEIKKIDHLLNSEEIKELYDNLFEILKYVGEDVILAQRSIPAALKAHVILMKRHGWKYLNDKSNVTDNFKLNTVFIDNFKFISNYEIHIEGVLTNFTKDTQIIAKFDGKEIPARVMRYPQRDNYSLNFNYGYNHCFKSIVLFKTNTVISFKTQNADLKIEYNQTSRLNGDGMYKISKQDIAIAGDNEIKIIKLKHRRILRLEVKTMLKMMKERSGSWMTALFLRILYIFIHPFFSKRSIWIFMDLPHAAGDNAFELFKYVTSQNNPDIEPYFVLEKSPESEYDYLVSSKTHKIKRWMALGKSSRQFEEVENVGKVLPYRSIKHRLFVLLSDFIITSHPDNTLIYPFWGNYSYLSGIIKSKTVFLQHGVTKDNVSAWLNEFDKPLSLLVTTSEAERKSFSNPDYGYSKDIIKALGFPRFDALKSNPQKKIVLMPSWRRNLDQKSASEFVKSNFYRQFNELLSDTDLISKLTDEGYELIFKPHRNLHKFIDTFTKHPDVKFDLDLTNYRETFNSANILITDYSSVAFDFAYMQKPVIYYQFDKGYHFDVENAYFSYRLDGFGPVVKDHEELKKAILNLVENDCRMELIYKSRVKTFFRYHDKNNSKRVYEEILKLSDYY
ncbi:MAG: CDP-glycerol glycerophosphotransferase family protein [Methanobrevibacter sp.]|uniref:bifunctional glycosyltransferase/CDP-glycerol:glycerophosphate glycerophosphotransferase n=1 Tax=Methanobrevibacter sp. TaxID=66852 RepID=UPI0025DC939E|nr:CDP-glycerol glycerophosphotransferase family protein [Methanobrevibacter sp.]MBQ6099320.1 CDP-glycerol glycerophosphotransferase family protein [Methanobrevibacter sp.]